MDIILAFIICFLIMLFSVFKGIFVGYPLIIGLLIFMFLAYKRGFKFKEILGMVYEGGKKSFVVLKIFILIGAITSTWMAAGTVPAVVYYGLKLLRPDIFILSAFVISSAISFLIGTSFGTISTVGMALMVMARSAGVDVNITAGAILSGAYFGDRCSPMSSSANLVASLTETELYANIKNMFKTSIVPLIVTIILYTILSVKHPLGAGGNAMGSQIASSFNISFLVLIPAVIIFVFSLFKIDVKLLMLISIIAAIILGITIQHVTIIKMIKYIFLGFSLDNKNPLFKVIKGGGIMSMLNVAIVVFISSAFAGIFEKADMLKSIEALTEKYKGRSGSFLATTIMSILTAAFGCSQAIAVILTNILMKKTYDRNNLSNVDMAIDIENTAIVIAPLIPWNIACMVPLASLSAGNISILYAFYLYLIPLLNFVIFKLIKGKQAVLST